MRCNLWLDFVAYRDSHMSRTFAYARVSTTGQTTAPQIQEIAAAGYVVDQQRIVEETISGGVQAMQRPEFARLVDRLEKGDILVCTKIDRLGRDAIDIQQTVKNLGERGVRVVCLALGGIDLTSPAGKMTMGVIAAMAEFERDLIRERTSAGLAKAKAEGKKLGRPNALSEKQRTAILTMFATSADINVSGLAREYGVDRRSIQRLRAGLNKKGDSQ